MALPPPLRGASGSARSPVPLQLSSGPRDRRVTSTFQTSRGCLLAECGLETPSKGILGNIAPADPCGHTTQPPGVVGCSFFLGSFFAFYRCLEGGRFRDLPRVT